MAGNKGAVAIRIEYANTRICFVTAHLAAGFANYDERNRDYRTISHGLRFQRNRSIEDHDTILWLGDFNYRIGLGHEKVHRLIEAGDLGSLYQNDQVSFIVDRELAFFLLNVYSSISKWSLVRRSRTIQRLALPSCRHTSTKTVQTIMILRKQHSLYD